MLFRVKNLKKICGKSETSCNDLIMLLHLLPTIAENVAASVSCAIPHYPVRSTDPVANLPMVYGAP